MANVHALQDLLELFANLTCVVSRIVSMEEYVTV